MIKERWRWNGKRVVKVKDDAPLTPRLQIVPDIKGYLSPCGTGWIDGRAARREDLKRTNSREVDPGEFKVKYTNPRFARKYGLPLSED
ncbi:MAG TPA: hypothetical protein VF175_15510 [Lacipirellula sp.]